MNDTKILLWVLPPNPPRVVPPPIPKAFGTPEGGLTCRSGSAGRDLGVDFKGGLKKE